VQLLKNFPAFYGTQRFVTEFIRALHWHLESALCVRFDEHYIRLPYTLSVVGIATGYGLDYHFAYQNT
jgi:prolipoprotein diacylglyceryltransferase